MTTFIQRPHIFSDFSQPSNEKHALIADLLKMLKTYALDRSFEHFGNFYSIKPIEMVSGDGGHDFETGQHIYYTETLPENVTVFFGNFRGFSYAFRIYTDDMALIETLKKAIDANKTMETYTAQETPAKVKPTKNIVMGLREWPGDMGGSMLRFQ